MQFHITYGIQSREKLDFVLWVNPAERPPSDRKGSDCGCMVYEVDTSALPEGSRTPPAGQKFVVCACNGRLIE